MDLIKIVQQIRNVAFPQCCIQCQREGHLWCKTCRADFICRTEQHCPGCGVVTVYGGRCAEHYDHVLDGVVSATWYANPSSKALMKLWKYRYVREAEPCISSVIGQWAFESQQIPAGEWIIVPLPLNPIRARQRGFDQSLFLAQTLSVELGIPMNTNIVHRKKHFNKPQAKLDDQDRRSRSFDGVFAINNKIAIPKQVILVDDVYTTGATMSAVASELKLAGVEVVRGFTFARGH